MGEIGAKRFKLEIDRLSSLPDPILADILALLPLRLAIATSFLSRRWRHIWTQLTRLDLDSKLGFKRPWLPTVNILFTRFASPKIHSLRVSLPDDVTNDNVQSYCSSLESCIIAVCSRHVEQIELQAKYSGMFGLPPVRLPTCMFQCHSIVVLNLKGNFNYDAGVIPCLPNLKILYFSVNDIHPEFLKKLFKSCTLLEQLSIRGCLKGGEPCLDLSALSLKKLYVESSKEAQLVINLSQLEEIVLHFLCLDLVSFVQHPSALITANLGFCSGLMDSHSNKLELAELLSGVTSLYLNPTTFKVFADLDDSLLPNFNNLTYLEIHLYRFGFSWNDVLGFLRFCPNVEALSLNYLEQVLIWGAPEYAPPCGLTNVKTIKISRFKGSKDDVEMIGYIMRYAKVLKLLSLDVSVPSRRKDSTLWKEYELCEKLFLIHSSSACEFQFSGEYLNMSSKCDISGRPCCQSLHLGRHLVLQ